MVQGQAKEGVLEKEKNHDIKGWKENLDWVLLVKGKERGKSIELNVTALSSK